MEEINWIDDNILVNMKESKKIILYFIVIAITLPCVLNLATSRFIYANKYPKLTNTELSQMSLKIFVWDHTPPKK